ncbi:ABC transporter ATP-binding protein [Rosistilla oblonga]|uniref:Lipoprotein-releasing system ATP-binding protein LolD n=1 Tax=Rosistilla oblonga TaxID=2527990 RepID=A0A518IML3_9BACT|nr:ABC transporter ATP-binding protein [Rosistilla oblonga]QDV54329.1 Lipoprotein-releasing system ATP-binding protein LolD [Rosistilla oblonga]
MNKTNEQPQPLLQCKGLRKVYPNGNVEALRGVDVEIFQGEYVAIMGTSGSGKSTLLCTLSGMDVPTSGEVLYRGKPLTQHGSLDRFRALELGFVFQSFYLLPTLTAIENVQVPMFEGPPRSSAEKHQRAHDLLERVGIGHRANHLPMRLSVGERQRVAIARSLANEPKLIFADEPTGNLDSRTTEEILAIFANLHETEGVTLVMVTHSGDVAAHAERTLHFQDGQIVKEENNRT